MYLFEVKEQVRAVYHFSKDDPSFDTFYEGLCYLGRGDAYRAATVFADLIQTAKDIKPAVFKYTILAMIADNRSPADIRKITQRWIDTARSSGDDKGLRMATTIDEKLDSMIEGEAPV